MIVDLPAFVRVLSGAGVDYIIIGGVAGALHGAARSTYDLDVVYSRSEENVIRLVAALSRIIRIYGAHRPISRSFSMRSRSNAA